MYNQSRSLKQKRALERLKDDPERGVEELVLYSGEVRRLAKKFPEFDFVYIEPYSQKENLSLYHAIKKLGK